MQGQQGSSKQKQKKEAGGGKGKKETLLFELQSTREGNFAKWYKEVITKAELIDYYDISGCYILRPWAFRMWELIQKFFDDEIKQSGVQNAYFPLFVSKSSLEREKEHIEGFAAEVAWVTKAGNSDLAEPIAVRPTSETIMYPAFSKWIRSHRDLPLRLNQWTNVVRWEFKHPVPFIRSREFLWQEGHSAFATRAEADAEVLEILELYRRVYEEILAIPVSKGLKSEKEKFAGGLYTTTCEAFIAQNGRAVQGATSHCLGQNFATIFDIDFEDESGEKKHVWQNSWGLTTRTLGILIMVHGDNKGLVLPPRVAPIQVVIVPIVFKDTDTQVLHAKTREVAARLKTAGFRVHLDDRDLYSPGWKYNYWEVRGVPLRVEVGPKDIANEQVVFARRDISGNKDKFAVPLAELEARTRQTLDEFQQHLFNKAKREREEHTKIARTWDEFMEALEAGNIVLTPWCDNSHCEEEVKAKSSACAKEAVKEAEERGEESFMLTAAAKTLCKPFEHPELPSDAVCFACGAPAKAWTLFGRSY
jgi:prolyl-tRNA synthetase